MSDDRRSFIKKFGMTLGSLIVSGSLCGCGPKKDGGLSAQSKVGKQSKPLPTPRGPQWGQLRQCWLNLNNTQSVHNAVYDNFRELMEQRQPQNDLGPPVVMHSDPFTNTKDVLAREHQAVLDTLVAKGQLKEPVAMQMQIAFEEAAYHVVRSMATCYIGLPIEYKPREDLLKQAEVLSEISGDLDAATVATAQAAIARDVAFLEGFKTKPNSRRAIADDYEFGDLNPSPEALEAARLLTQLFLETPD